MDLKPLHGAILNGDFKFAKAITEQAVAAGHEPLELVQRHMIPDMVEVGRRLKCMTISCRNCCFRLGP